MNSNPNEASLQELLHQQQETIGELHRKLKITAQALPLIKLQVRDRDSLIRDLKARIARLEEQSDSSKQIQSILDDFAPMKAEMEKQLYDGRLQAVQQENDRLREQVADLQAELQLCHKNHAQREQSLQDEVGILERALDAKNALLDACKQALKLQTSVRNEGEEEAARQSLYDS